MAKLKILKEGETNIDSTDIWRFTMHSGYPSQKIYEAAQTTLTILSGNTGGTKTISHSLGYAPIVMAMFENYSGKYVKVNGHKHCYRPDDNEAQIYYIKSTLNSVIFGADPLPTTAPAAADIDIIVYYIILYEEI
jgi:hypothetical protein